LIIKEVEAALATGGSCAMAWGDYGEQAEKEKEKEKAPDESEAISSCGTEGRNRTGTPKGHRFLRPTCLPIPPLRQSGVIIVREAVTVKPL
jgi:hypothetical protein